MSDETPEETDGDGSEETPDGAAVEQPTAARGSENAGVPASLGAWDAVVGDMESTADAYEEAGWETLQCHPGDVTVVTDEEGETTPHVDVLLPDNEYADVEALLESGVSFGEYEVLKAEEGGVLYFVVVMEDPEEEVALLYPGYYQRSEAEELLEHARESGELLTRLRRLDGEYVELVHEDPELFAPEE
ncbi:DUF7529 family protein [Halospeciosus flavus]|uniref:Uncharacterized protein n=1 Tax=Halospeciosus flavus TaxID=3032283 RepID=A0ABD5Z6U6_9EURY|nr:hypothetical protein [Halospeciosus flavus]